ncbi:MAG: DUF5050 domain-containing protein [Calditrichaeota bacterium]|nr:MAG: DUF5050 domain-containing protein [Calditrichota bacterium]MBL1205231.1 DUF5050 domain-containing protein [Calditrichota bacterium]NOG45060.1 serine/threonine-protein kinase [Calditrichota bacterium]
MTSETILHYKILKKIGAGAMGVVYQARDLKLNRLVVLKFLPPELTYNSEAIDRFINEAQTASALDHANICTIYEVNETDDGQMFICMANYEGQTLNDKIKNGPIESVEAMEIVLQIAAGLRRAHEEGIIHRDIKPGNIIITNRGEVKIIDFGIAVLAGQDRLTKAGSSLGTVAYMSPEQVQGKGIDNRSDIWSLGVVLYEILTGKLPYSGENEVAIIYSIVNTEFETISASDTDLSLSLQNIITKALAKNSDERYPSIEEMQSDLQALKKGKSISASYLESSQHVKQLKPLYLLAAIVTLSAVGLMWFFLGQTNDREYSPSQIKTVTSFSGNEAHPTFSPDGNQIAFAWNGKGEDNYDIYVKLIGMESISRLTTDPKADFRPSWSPGGSRIAFQRQDSREKASIYIMPSIGGQGRKVAEIYTPNYGYQNRYNKIAWHPNEEWLVISDKKSVEEPLGLFLLSIETGEKTRLTFPDSISSAGGDLCASFSKDGNYIVFNRMTSWLKSNLYALELNSDLKPINKPTLITSPDWYIDGTGFTHDGAEIIYSSNNLWRIARSDPSNPTQILTGNKIADIAISVQGNRLVYRQDQNEVNIWRMSLKETSIIDQPAERLISSTGIDGEPVYSPDGQKIAFLSNRSGIQEIWICDNDGSNLFQLTSLEKLFTNGPSWSPDGKFIVFDTVFERKQDLYIINVEGGIPRRLTTHPDIDWLAAWSRDGKWIYFTSQRSGEGQLWKIKPDGKGLKQLTRNGGLAPVESADGQHIYYAKDRSYPTSIWKVSVNGENEQQVVEQFKGWRKFFPVENGIYFVLFRDIKFFNFDTGKTNIISSLDRDEDYGITVSPDRSYLLYGLRDRKGSDLFLVENFN